MLYIIFSDSKRLNSTSLNVLNHFVPTYNLIIIFTDFMDLICNLIHADNGICNINYTSALFIENTDSFAWSQFFSCNIGKYIYIFKHAK